jgi:F0F1-type ATP synthase assembly protein I
MSSSRFVAGLLIGLGLGLVAPQVVADDPWQLGVCGGLLLVVFGLLALAGEPREAG